MRRNDLLRSCVDFSACAVAQSQETRLRADPLRGGKGGYFEGGVRVASFVHSPLLPAAVRGTVLDATISVADWWATLVTLAGLEPVDSGFQPSSGLALPEPWGCVEHGKCSFEVDGLDMWPLITGKNRTAPRYAQTILAGSWAHSVLEAGPIFAAGRAFQRCQAIIVPAGRSSCLGFTRAVR